MKRKSTATKRVDIVILINATKIFISINAEACEIVKIANTKPIRENITDDGENTIRKVPLNSIKVPTVTMTIETIIPTNIGWALNRNAGNLIKYHAIPVVEPAMAEIIALFLEIAFQNRPMSISGNRPVLRNTKPTIVQNSTPDGIRIANPTVKTDNTTMEIREAATSWVELASGRKYR